MELEAIKERVESKFNINDITIQKRTRKYVIPRMVYSVLAQKFTPSTLKEISEVIERDHSTVIYLIKNFENQMRYEAQAFRWYLELESEFSLETNKTTKIDVLELIDKIPSEKLDDVVEVLKTFYDNGRE